MKTVTLDSLGKQCKKRCADGEKLKNKLNFTIGKNSVAHLCTLKNLRSFLTARAWEQWEQRNEISFGSLQDDEPPQILQRI